MEQRLAEAEKKAELEAWKARVAKEKTARLLAWQRPKTKEFSAKWIMLYPIRKLHNFSWRNHQQSWAYNQGFIERKELGMRTITEKLSNDLCQCKNCHFKHEWTKALKSMGIDFESSLYKNFRTPFEADDTEKTNDKNEGPNAHWELALIATPIWILGSTE